MAASLQFLSSHVTSIVAFSLFLVAALWFRYRTESDRSEGHSKREGKEAPLVFPYIFPLLGSLPITYLWRPRDFVANTRWFFQSPNPVLVKILTYEFYVIRGPENIKALFKNSWACTSIPFVKFALGYAFGLPPKALALYDKDDSGGNLVPHPDSTVEARNRIDYRVHHSLTTFLEGKGLAPFWSRFAKNISQNLHLLNERIGNDWTNHADLMRTVGDVFTVSTLDALCGPHLLRLNPTFLQDFWAFDRNLQKYLQGMPWFLAPRAYRARDRALKAVQVWQQHARENFDSSAIGPDGDDPFWGCSFFRERQDMFLEMDGYDKDAIASQELGAIWASRNSITAASWTIFEIYRDPELLASVREELNTCMRRDSEGRMQFDTDQLLRLPILQAAYAETLRLRMHFYIARTADRVDLNIRDWIIPRQKVVIALTTVAHMDAAAWNTGMDNEHPVEQFWVGRFLKYPTNSSGDQKEAQTSTGSGGPIFSTKHVEGSWIPYGGGPRQCPGRHFAKRQILLTTALMISLMDCEILPEGLEVQEDFSLKGFGGGMSHPDRKVPVRLRAREAVK